MKSHGQNVKLETGQVADIEGISDARDYAPVIFRPQINVVGRGQPPTPRQVSNDRLASGKENSQWTEGRGIVRSVSGGDHIFLELTLTEFVSRGRFRISARKCRPRSS